MNNNIRHYNEEIEIDVKRVIETVFKKMLIIILVTVLGGISAFVVSKWIVPQKYESKVRFYVNNRNIDIDNGAFSVSAGDISVSRSLVETYIAVLESRSTLMEAVEQAGADYTYKEIKKLVKAQAIGNTELFEVTVTSKNNVEAYKIADAISDILPNKIAEVIDGTSVKIVDKSIVSNKPVSPKVARWTFLGAVLAMFATVGTIILYVVFDTTIRTVEDIKQVCTYPVLVVVPDMAKNSSKETKEPKDNDITGSSVVSTASEAYKILRTKLLISLADKKDSHVVGISSAISGEGKSVTAINLAYTMAQLNKKVVLVDCNMRNSSSCLILQLNNTLGISDYLTNQAGYDDVVQSYSDKEKNVMFRVITAGSQLTNPVELLSSSKMAEIIEKLKNNYEYIILDLPAVSEFADTMVTTKYADSMLIVSRMNHVNQKLFVDALEQFKFANANILGVVATFA